MATNVAITVNVYDEDGVALSGATVKIIDQAGTVVSNGATSGATRLDTVSTSLAVPALWKFVVTATGYYKAGGFLVFTTDDGTVASASVYLYTNPG